MHDSVSRRVWKPCVPYARVVSRVARCYSCHGLGNGEGSAVRAMPLEVLLPGAAVWNEEQ